PRKENITPVGTRYLMIDTCVYPLQRFGIPSGCSEVPPCLQCSVRDFWSLSRAVRRHSQRLVRDQDASLHTPTNLLSVCAYRAPVGRRRIKPHSVEHGGRFSPIHF